MERLPHALLSLLVLGCSTDTFSTIDGGDDGSSDAPPGIIACKALQACLAGTQVCCLRTDQPDDECIPRPSKDTAYCPDAQGYVVACDEDTDCPRVGDVCCGTVQQSAFSSLCTPKSLCAGGNRFILCDPSGKPCPDGGTCTQSGIKLYYGCQ